MNKSFLKFITDFGPLLIFFIVYYKSGKNLTTAIPPLIIATIIAVALVYFIEKKIPYVPLVGGIVITLFGGLTLYFNIKQLYRYTNIYYNINLHRLWCLIVSLFHI